MENQNNSANEITISPTKVAAVIGILIFLLITIAPGYYFFRKYQKAQKQLNQVTLTPQEDGKAILENVRKLIDLPVDEEPTIATILDKEKVKDQPFFANAKNGDKVIIFNKNKKALLYDPIENRIIEMGPLIVPSPTLILPKLKAATITPEPTVTNTTESPDNI